MSKTRFDFVEEKVNSLFSNVFEVYYSPDKRSYKIEYRPYEDPVDPSDPCLIFHFNEDLSNLYIDKIRKRIKDHPSSGSAFLELIDKLANLIPECKTISVITDNLNVYKCSYAMKFATISILLNGISWYNHMGYRQASFMDDTEYNREIINMTVKAAYGKLLLISKSIGSFPDLMNHMIELNKLLHFDHRETMKLTLSAYIRSIYIALTQYSEDSNECNTFTTRQSQLSVYIINAFGHLLQYNNKRLVKRVNNPPPFIAPPGCRHIHPVATAKADADPISGSSSNSILRDDTYMARYAAKEELATPTQGVSEGEETSNSSPDESNWTNAMPSTMTASNFERGNHHNLGEGGGWQQVYDGSQFSAVSAANPVCPQQQQQQQFGSLLQKPMEGPEAMMGSYGGAIKSRKPKRRMNRRTKRRTTRRAKRSYVHRGHSKGAKKIKYIV